MKSKKRFITLAVALVLIITLTFCIFYFKKNGEYTNRERMFILAYQTNIAGSDGEQWAKSLKTQFTEVPDFEVGVYSLVETGNSQITITEENGWAQIVTRLAAKQGDILFLNNKVFYETMLANGFLLPLAFDGERAVRDESGNVYGIDITDLHFEGLNNTGTSEYVGQNQPLPIKSTDEESYILNGEEIAPRVIACVYAGSTRQNEAVKVLIALADNST